MEKITEKPSLTTIDEIKNKQFILTGVDFTNPYTGWDITYDTPVSSANCIRLRLDGANYVFMEDPDDGYRSQLGEIFIDYNSKIDNEFEPTFVKVKEKTRDEEYTFAEECSILEFVDIISEKVVVKVGTANTNDYYPWFVYEYHPQNLYFNEGR